MPAKKPYRHPAEYRYYSERYNRTVTIPAGYRSDGATRAIDIWSEAWWVHDLLCDRGTWDDGAPVTNWQASVVLSDILQEEGHGFRAWSWLAGTFLFGGGKCRRNGMFRLKRKKRFMQKIHEE